jgi:hypothetical protein
MYGTCLLSPEHKRQIFFEFEPCNESPGVHKQWMPLNGISLSQTTTDPINQMITITKLFSYTKYAIERHFGLVQYMCQFDPINQMTPLTMIPLSGAHSDYWNNN